MSEHEHNYAGSFYHAFVLLGHFIAPFFLLALRLFWGILFLFAGLHKFGDIGQVTEAFAQLKLPYPAFNAYLVAFVETVGGAFLAVGFLSRIVAFPLVITMLTALGTAHVNATLQLFNDPAAFLLEAPLTYLMASLTVFCFGPGIFSLDAFMEKFFCKNRCS